MQFYASDICPIGRLKVVKVIYEMRSWQRFPILALIGCSFIFLREDLCCGDYVAVGDQSANGVHVGSVLILEPQGDKPGMGFPSGIMTIGLFPAQ